MAIASTLQAIQNDVATQMNLPPQETIAKSLNRYKRKFANALPHIPHGKDFQIPEEFKETWSPKETTQKISTAECPSSNSHIPMTKTKKISFLS